MLRFLRIRNLAVVEAVDVDFESGFTVLTGETGAGKSIVVEAVALLLGGRASADLIRTGESTASVEALFEDRDGEIVVKRELTAQGRSRAFVNGELTTSTALKALALRLVELHGQHEHQALLDPTTHIPTLDEFAGLGGRRAEVALAWDAYQAADRECDRASLDERERQARLDLLAFQLGEIDKVAPRRGEDEELASTRRLLASAERVERLCLEAYGTLYERDASVLSQLAGVWRRVEELVPFDRQFDAHLTARTDIKSQLEDLASALRSRAAAIDASPERLQATEERLAAIERLKKKHGPSLEDVLARRESLRAEHDQLMDPAREMSVLVTRRDAARDTFLSRAQALSRERRLAGQALASRMAGVLGRLAMGKARFEVRLVACDDPAQWDSTGIDQGEFFIAPNPGEEPRPLARIVSGGELSRVMLALKTLAAERDTGQPPRTLIFDEVDAGIGGQVAAEVASHLEELGRRFQVLSVTHLPQIAARGAQHLLVRKSVAGHRTRVTVSRLRDEGARVEELARMIGGSTVTDALRASARDLLARRVGAKQKEKAKGESERVP